MAQEYEVRVGRPKGGNLRFRVSQLSRLPSVGNASEMGRALGVSPTLVMQWIGLGLQAQQSTTGRYTIAGPVLRAWLISHDRTVEDVTEQE